jgi:hypothetical protein
MLGDSRVEVVLDHQHDRRRLPRLGGIVPDRPRVHRVMGPVAAHHDAAVLAELAGEFGGENRVVPRREVPERVLQGEDLFIRREP